MGPRRTALVLAAIVALPISLLCCVGADAPVSVPSPTAEVAGVTGPVAETSLPTLPSPSPTATPVLDPRAAKMCAAAALSATIVLWHADPSGPYADVVVTNTSTASCGLTGTPGSQIIDGAGELLASEPSATASGASLFRLRPGGTARTTVRWTSWCAWIRPTQQITVALVLPYGLGTIVAAAAGSAPVPGCAATASFEPSVGADPWTL